MQYKVISKQGVKVYNNQPPTDEEERKGKRKPFFAPRVLDKPIFFKLGETFSATLHSETERATVVRLDEYKGVPHFAMIVVNGVVLAEAVTVAEPTLDEWKAAIEARLDALEG